MATDAEIEDFLIHHGVKGMHWGVRKTPEEQRVSDLKRVNRQIKKINTDKLLPGYELQGYGIKKQHAKEVKKNPNFTYGKLSPEDKKAYLAKANARVTRSVMTRGILEVSAILAGGNIALNSAKMHSDTRNGARIGVLLLAGKVGTTRVQQLSALHTVNKLENLHERRAALGGKP